MHGGNRGWIPEFSAVVAVKVLLLAFWNNSFLRATGLHVSRQLSLD